MKILKSLTLAGFMATAATSAQAISLMGPTVSYGGHDYTLISADNWTNSEAFAASQGGHLVAVNDSAENSFIINTFGLQNALWIGLFRTSPHANSWAWTNGDAVTFTNWSAWEPNDCCGGEDYVHTYTNGQWNDLADDNEYAGPKYGILEVVSRDVPEPSPFVMLVAGLAGLVFTRRLVKKS